MNKEIQQYENWRKRIAKEIFEDIFKLIDECLTNTPKTIENSQFYNKLIKMKKDYTE